MKLVMHFDGGSRGNPGPAGAGVVIRDGQGRPVFEAGYSLDRMTNNMAEYYGLLKGLEAAHRVGGTEITIMSDSELVVRQINGDYRVKNARLRDLFDAALVELRRFERWTIRHVPREANERADELANLAMDAGEDVILSGATEAGAKATAGARIAGARIPSRTSADESASPPPRKSTQKKHPALPDQLPAAPDRPSPESLARSIVARCVRASNPGACPVPCESGQEFVFDRTAPAGICLELAAQLLPAVRAVQKSGKPAKVYCPNPACGACFEVRLEQADRQ